MQSRARAAAMHSAAVIDDTAPLEPHSPDQDALALVRFLETIKHMEKKIVNLEKRLARGDDHPFTPRQQRKFDNERLQGGVQASGAALLQGVALQATRGICASLQAQ